MNSQSDRLSTYTCKYLYINDAFLNYREKFVREAFSRSKILSYRLLFDGLPRTFERTDILIVGGNDPQRLMSFIKINLPILTRIPKIALGQNLNPVRRAALLRLGYDDVLNLKDLGPDELGSRVLMILGRYRTTESQNFSEEIFKNVVEIHSSKQTLTASEKSVLRLLIETPGNFCTGKTLSKAASHDHIEVSPAHLRVLIHNIRQHLAAGYAINTVYGEGYRFSVPKSEQ